VTNGKVEMETMAQNFFHGLYRADPDVNPQEVLHLFQPCISAGLNLDLCKDFTSEEISDTLFQIGPLKAPGPDGFSGVLFPEKLGGYEDRCDQGSATFFPIRMHA
jgi:hypothetical protein